MLDDQKEDPSKLGTGGSCKGSSPSVAIDPTAKGETSSEHHLLPHDGGHSLLVEPGLFIVRSGHSLQSEMGPVRSLLHIDSLEQVDLGKLNAQERQTYQQLWQSALSTRAKYQQRFRRFMSGAPIQAPSTMRARSNLHSAMKWGYRLNTLHPDRAVAAQWVALLAQPIVLPERHHLAMGEADGVVFIDQIGRTKHRRTRLKQLGRDFVGRSVAAAATSSEVMRFAFVVLALTGCRPGEVSSCAWELDDATQTLELVLQTSKVRGPDARRSRSLTMRPDSSDFGRLVADLVSFLQECNDDRPFTMVTAKKLENLCARLSFKVWPQRRPGLNCSCFRCQFIADLKADGVDRQTIAVLAGHEDLDSAKHYGLSSQGNRGCRAYLQFQHSAPSDRSQNSERDWL